jgi:hypothetical protein
VRNGNGIEKRIKRKEGRKKKKKKKGRIKEG